MLLSTKNSQNGMLNCIPHHAALINKVTAFNREGSGRACERVPVERRQRASAPPRLQPWCCKQNRGNKLESQEEKSFMSDALITKTSRFLH